MSFALGFLAASVMSIVVGAILFHVYGKPKVHNEANSLKKIFLSVPFLSLLIFALVCLAIAVVLELIFIQATYADYQSFLSAPKTWVAFSKEMFFAAFIALIIIIVVEVASSDEQAELMEGFKKDQAELLQDSIGRAQKSVFEGVYKNSLHPAIFEEVVDSIFQASFVRPEHHRSMVLEEIKESPTRILMKVRQTYVVENVSGGPRRSNQRFHLPNTRNFEGHLNRFVSISVVSLVGDNKIPDIYPYRNEAGEEVPDEIDVSISESGAECVYTFPAVDVVEGGKIKIDLELHLVKDISDNEILTFLSPTLKGSFSVHSYVDGLEVQAISLHRGALSETPDGGPEFKRWTFDRPMLPYQGYVVMWTRPT